MKRKYTRMHVGLMGTAAAIVCCGSASLAQVPTQSSSPNQTTSPATGGTQTGTGGAASTALTALPGVGGTVPAATTATPLPADALPSLTPAQSTPGPQISGSNPSFTTSLARSLGLGAAAGAQAAPVTGQTFTLQQVLTLAHTNEPTFLGAAAAARSAHYDTLIAKAGLLPTAIYHNQYLYTKAGRVLGANGVPEPNNVPIFIANNAVHEYVSQASITETLGAVQYLAVGRALAQEAVAKAELEISRRGLTATVVSLFYGTNTTLAKVAVQQRAVAEANDFLTITRNRETAREAAHADVVKAQLTLEQRQRDLADADLLSNRAKIDLGILLFPDPRTQFGVNVSEVQPPPSAAAVEAAASMNNPELASAMATVKSRGSELNAARAALLPDVVLNYAYGIDGTNFAKRTPQGLPLLGYSASATVDVPVWDWLAGVNRIHQAALLRNNSKAVLSATQRTLIARLAEYNAEAQTAYKQIESLRTSADDAREALRLATLRYQNGEAQVLEVTDAQNTLVTAELALTDGVTRYQVALASLQLLTGTI